MADWRKIILSTTILAAIPALAGADIITLTDGTRIEGKARRTSTGYNITLPDGSVMFVEADRVRSFELTPTTQPNDGRAASALASLKRAMEQTTDPAHAIARYEQFIATYRNTPAADDAEAELKVWKDRRDRGMIRVGGEWVTSDRADAIHLEQAKAALAARELVAAGRLREAEQSLRQAITRDPANASAHYLLGVVQFRLDQVAPARRSFEAVLQLLPDHAPAQNNLALVLVRQRQYGPAMSAMDAALQSAPGARELLDNVAELLEAAPEEVRKGLVGQRLGRRFTELDARLQETMRAQGLFRWGSSWVNQAELNTLRETESRVNARIAELQHDFDVTQQRLNRIDADIQANEQTLRSIEARTWMRDADGRVVRLPLPPAYYDVQQEINRLRGERADQELRIRALRDAAQRAREELPKPRYTGQLMLIGEDGVPIPQSALEQLFPPPPPADPGPVAPPATQPSTQPDSIAPPADPPTTQPTTRGAVLFAPDGSTRPE